MDTIRSDVVWTALLACIGGAVVVDPWEPVVVVDPTVPSEARIYDYLLGGKDNFPADRAAAEQVVELGRLSGFDVKEMTRANRAYLVRVVSELAQAGVRQFVDIGAGLPTQQNVHEVARSVAPDTRVVYVDKDPIVLTHARALLADTPQTIAVAGDLFEPGKILADDAIREHLNFDEPVAILVMALMNYVIDDQLAARIAATLRDGLPSGGYLAISHAYATIAGPGKMAEAQELFKETGIDFVHRAPEQVAQYFAGLEMLEPGIVPIETWRPRDDQWPGVPDNSGYLGGVGRKP
jgi:O-methyltransferase involved in polyketide biosynthesis